jgi:peptidoglycan/LPS O-acetylase OafA/YrhL
MQTDRPLLGSSDRSVSSRTSSPGRLHYLDWLRALAVLGVFVYHSLQPFSTDDWHVKNGQLSDAIGAVMSFVDAWGVAFFFLIAGASTFLSLRRRSAGAYVRERLSRLLLPLAVAYLLLSTLQAYIEERHFGRYSGSLFGSVPLFFEEVGRNLHDTLLHPLLIGGMYHLWFVVFLLWFALLGLPLFLWLRGTRGLRLSRRLGDDAWRRGWILLFAAPIAVVPLAVMPLWPAEEDWGSFVYLFGFYVAGGLLLSDDRLAEAVRRDVVWALSFAIAVDVAIFLTGVPGFVDAFGEHPAYSWMYIWAYAAIVAQSWAWVLVLLGLGMRAKAFRPALPRRIAEASMPFFIVHQPVILAVAFWVVRWNAGIPAKWIVVVAVSFTVSAAIATGLARVPVLSAAFGVKRASRAIPRASDSSG